MRWGTLWLTAVLVGTTTAQVYQRPTAIEHDPLNVDPPNIPKEIIPEAELATSTSNEKPTTESQEDDVSSSKSLNVPQPPVKSDEDENSRSATKGSASDSSEEPTNSASITAGEQINQGSDDSEDDLIIDTKSGQVQGYKWQDNENIISYIDIPYGTFDHPFQAAKAAAAWRPNIHKVKDHDKRCPQMDKDEYVGVTDCLTLSIFKPLEADGASVLFHIHADNFNSGSGDPAIYGPEYLISSGIILVLPNYRLGALGFLCMQNETAPGNMALKDLTLALSWIKDNIKAFGGDPDKLAVSGDGRSGALAGFLALSPMSKGYVNKVIAESGSFFSYWALDRDPIATAQELFDQLPEASGSSSTTVMIHDRYTVQDIVETAKDIDFRPCVETNKEEGFLLDVPYATMSKENFENTFFLLGSATYAGIHESLIQTTDSIRDLNDNYALLLPKDLKFTTASIRNQVARRVKEQYFGDEAISLEDRKHLSLCFTDIGYLGPGIRSARLLTTANATVYFYEFAYVGKLNRVLQSVDNPVEGAVRGDIVGYLFTQDSAVPTEDNDKKMVRNLIEMWKNFLIKGSPTTDDIEWGKLESKDHENEEWLLIDLEPTMKKGLHVDRMSLWTDIYNEHFIDNDGHVLTPSVLVVLTLQLLFWFGFSLNASHVY